MQRSAKLVCYAPKHGWVPHVLSMRRPLTADQPRDDAMAAEVADADVRRLPRLDLRLPARAAFRLGLPAIGVRYLWLLPADGYLGWIPFAIREARRVIADHPVSAVYTSSFPYSVHLLGLWARREFGIPWIADFRDPWTTNDRYPQYRGNSLLSRYKTAVDRRIEAACVRNADAITVVVDQHRRDLIDSFGADPARVHLVMNGYDERDFADWSYPMQPNRSCFRITFLGRFSLDLSIEAFAPMFRAFLATCPEPDRVRLRCVGESANWMRSNPEAWGDFEESVELVDYVRHSDVPGLMSESAVLLVLFPKVWSMTGKLFEYLRSGLPVFGVGPDQPTPMGDLLDAAGTGWVVGRSEVSAGAELLARLFEAWRSDADLRRPNYDAVVGHSRDARAALVAEIMNAVVDQAAARQMPR